MPKAKILIVEDDLITAKNIEGHLQNFGYEVTAIATSGSGALSQIKKNPPDLVLMDIKLRGKMDGIETADLIRIRFDIPVVYVTAYADFRTLVRTKKTEPIGFIAKPVEIKELKSVIETGLYKYQMEKKLKERDARLFTTLRSIGDAVIVTDTSGKITFMNPVAEELTGWKEEESRGKTLKRVFKIINDDTGKPVENPVERALKEGKVVGLANHTVLIAKDGKHIPIDDSGSPINDDKGNIIGVVLNFKDITERRRAEEELNKHYDNLEKLVEERTKNLEETNKRLENEITCNEQTEKVLRVSEERFRSLVETSADLIFRLSITGRIDYISPRVKELYGYDVDELIGKNLRVTTPLQDIPEVLKALNMVIAGNSLKNFKINQKDKAGRIIPMEINAAPIYVGTNIVGLQGVMRDITERKKAEEQIQKDLKEKEILLKEIHHRVKNNLQVINSLLHLQARHIKDKQALEMFEESRNRVRSMAFVYERLYHSRDFSKVDFADYVKNLSNSLFRAYSTAPDKIKLRTRIGDVSLGIDLAIPCGLIINELVSNTLKHAFPPSFKGKAKIEIALHPTESGELELIVMDNGVGIPKEPDIRKTESLGMQLVFILAEDQLDGEVKLDRSGGTKFTIRLKQE